MTTLKNPAPGFSRNPDKKITIEPHRGTVTVRAGDTVVASSSRALVLNEPPYPAVFYVPFEDLNFDVLEKTSTSTHCPYKGDASYWNVGGAISAMWAYVNPYDEVAEIRNHGAFYPDRVIIETA
jgi:uncharacterized protein (DUF427 family)